MSGPGLLPRAMSESVALIQSKWSVLMSMAPITIEGPADTGRLVPMNL